MALIDPSRAATFCARMAGLHPYRAFAGRRHSRGSIVEAKKWIAVTGELEFANGL
jgi:hypothetical protein